MCACVYILQSKNIKKKLKVLKTLLLWLLAFNVFTLKYIALPLTCSSLDCYIYLHAYIHTYLMYICMFVGMYVCMYVCKYKYIYI